LVKKDPNHARIERERRLREERERKEAKYAALEKGGGAGPTEGDAFDRAGLGGRSSEERDRNRDLAERFVEDMVQPYPEIEVFTPLGKYVGARRPMCGSVLGGPKYVSSRERKARPRRAMAPVRGKQSSERKQARRTTSG
jgi:hypothetical protein